MTHDLDFIAQRRDDSGMCDDADPCGEIELNYSIPHHGAHPRAINPLCLIPNNISNTHDDTGISSVGQDRWWNIRSFFDVVSHDRLQ